MSNISNTVTLDIQFNLELHNFLVHFRPRFRWVCTNLCSLIWAWVLVCSSQNVIGFQPYIFKNFPYSLILSQGPDPTHLSYLIIKVDFHSAFTIPQAFEYLNNYELAIRSTSTTYNWISASLKNVMIPFSFLGDYIATGSGIVLSTMIAFNHYIILVTIGNKAIYRI